MLVNAKVVQFKSFFRFAFFSTHLVGGVFASVLFMQMLNPRQGLINRTLGLFIGHVPEMQWLAASDSRAAGDPGGVALAFGGMGNDLFPGGAAGGGSRSYTRPRTSMAPGPGENSGM